MSLKKVFFILSFASWFTTIAQQVWSLEQCVDFAIENNLQLNDFEFTEQSNKETYRQSVRNLLPNVNGFADYNISFGRQVNPNDNSISNTEFFSNNYSIVVLLMYFKDFRN